jgi:hypothetical protein
MAMAHHDAAMLTCTHRCPPGDAARVCPSAVCPHPRHPRVPRRDRGVQGCGSRRGDGHGRWLVGGGWGSRRAQQHRRPYPRHAHLLLRATAVAQLASTKKDIYNKTYYPTSADTSNSTKRWYIIDAEGQTLGRLACLAATYIR